MRGLRAEPSETNHLLQPPAPQRSFYRIHQVAPVYTPVHPLAHTSLPSSDISIVSAVLQPFLQRFPVRQTDRPTDRRSQVTERNNRPRRELLAVLAMRATNPHTRGELVGRPPAERGHAPGKLYATSGGGGGGGVLTRAIQLSDCSPQTTACLLHRPHQSIIQQCDFRFDLLLFSSSFSFNLVYFQRSFSF